MNIYKRQMERLGLNLEQYSKLTNMPIEITKKIINDEGVVEDMNINNFLRKNMFEKHQEIENEENKQIEALEIKTKDKIDLFEEVKARKEEAIKHPNIQKLIELYPDDKALYWYLFEFDKEEYFSKYNIGSYSELTERYDFTTNVGRCTGKICLSTLNRVCNRKYEYLGYATIYEVAKLLYDCFENGNLLEKQRRYRKPRNPMLKGTSIIENNEEKELRNWYKDFDLREFIEKNNISVKEFGKKIGLAKSSTFAFLKKSYKPSTTVIKNAKEFISTYQTEIENAEDFVSTYQTVDGVEPKQITIDETVHLNNNTTITKIDNETGIFIEPIEPNNENSILKELLKERLTEQEKYLIRLFGGNI